MAAEMETRLRDSVWTLSLDLYKYERFNLVSVLHILSFLYWKQPMQPDTTRCNWKVLRVLRPTLAQVSELDLKQQDAITFNGSVSWLFAARTCSVQDM
jgi:hypothetical protein